MRRRLLEAVGVLLAFSPMLALLGTAHADDSKLTVSHVEPTDGGVRILVSVPPGAEPDLAGIGVTIGGVETPAEAAPAGDANNDQVKRTTVLAMDTSDSMEGDRFTAAKAAAGRFLELVPEDVLVGIVTFNRQVTTALAPTVDHDAAKAVVDGLELDRGTRLNDGVISAIGVAGTEGQRNVLLLSDGLNSNKTPLSLVEDAIEGSEVQIDAVALDQSAADQAPLEAIAKAGQGSVISADPEALTAAFTAEADSLARQILITTQVPTEVTGTEAELVITVPDGTQTHTAKSFSVIRAGAESSGAEVPTAAHDEGIQIPPAAMYGGIAAIGIGLLVLLGSMMSMATAGIAPKSVEQRIAAFGAGGAHTATSVRNEAPSSFNLDEVKAAAGSMLHRNRGLEARIEQRLEAAGSSLKPAEWLLLHGAVAFLSGLVGLLLGNGGILLLLLFLLLGVLVPWMWLGHKRRKRVRAFNSGLADCLQLISGSLSAGMSLAQSLDSVVNEGNEPIAGEFKRVLVETRLGVPLEVALEGIAQRLESKDFAWVVMAIRIQREVGGNLAELLTTVAATLRERDYLRRQVKSLSAEGRLSAYILVGLPIGMLVYMLTLRREYVMPLFTEPLGLLLLIVAVVLLALGWFMMSRIVKVEV
jgi:tight adherence protein B